MPTFVIGDIHGHYDKLVKLLKTAGLLADDLAWTGQNATLCLLGDYFDRGPDGIRIVDLLISQQILAEREGGRVVALLGNHEITIMAAHRFGTRRGTTGPAGNFYNDWKRVGGVQQDIDRLSPEHIAWMTELPVMALIDDRLMIHADSSVYLNYGDSIDEVNRNFQVLMSSFDLKVFDKLLSQFSEKYAFSHRDWNGKPKQGGEDKAREFLATYGGQQIVHGHTPIHHMAGKSPSQVKEAFTYANGLVINVDPGMYSGGPGFLYELPPPGVTMV